jgi:hypothetical protein
VSRLINYSAGKDFVVGRVYPMPSLIENIIDR